MTGVFKALSDPTRRKIIELLKEGDKSAGEIAEYFSMTKPSISNHLTILKSAELVQSVREGQKIIYSLNSTIFQEVTSWLYTITNKGENNEKE